MFKKLYRLLSIIILLIAVAAWGWLRLNSPIGNTASATPLSMTINKGDGNSAMAEQLSALSKKNGGSLSVFEIQALSFVIGAYDKLKAGDYEFSSNSKLAQILNKFAKGDVTANRVRIPEGATWRDIKAILAKADLNHDAQSLDLAQAASTLNINATSIEGMLFPDTYQYRKGENETAVLKRAHQTLLQKLNAAWAKRAANVPYATPYEALIMASIIEKETGTASDRALVAAVFVNRLKANMRLQTDPSVIYGMGERFKGNISKADLQRSTPFNTYTQDGLTPTPIATASAASIEAALNPASSDVLYFVARGDGSSEFSKTLAEHNAAVQKYQLK